MTVTRVFAFRACTNAARKGAPSGPVTLPVIVAPNAIEEMRPTALTKLRNLSILGGCMTPPCNRRLRPLNPRITALTSKRSILAGENGSPSDQYAILLWPGCNAAEATKQTRRLSMEICDGSVPTGRKPGLCASYLVHRKLAH